MANMDDLAIEKKLKVLAAEFSSKVTPDFTRYIFLSLKENRSLDEVIGMTISCEGYESHKLVYCEDGRVSHFYARFRDRTCAEKAGMYFSKDKQFNAYTVNSVLISWYLIEKTSRSFQSGTSAFVDIDSNVDCPLPLPSDIEKSIAQQFRCSSSASRCVDGDCFRYLTVTFSSVAEALGASIINGIWYCKERLEKRPVTYRVRIFVTDKEANLFKSCGITSPEAFGLDYFMTGSNISEIKVPSNECEKNLREDCIPELNSQKPYPKHISRGKFARSYRRHIHNGSKYTSFQNTQRLTQVPES